MIKVGITGGIGSGKTMVCKIFQELGIPVFYADDEAKNILDKDIDVKKELKRLFGENIYTKTGINKTRLASIIFNDNEALKQVNELIHPKVREYFNMWSQEHCNFPYIIEEAAILFESGAYKDLDINILVSAPEELKIQRIMERDKVDRQSVVDRMKNQMGEREKKKMADYIIVNDGKQMIIPQILEIHKKIKRKSTNG